jgi:hypothetical protein
MSSLSDVITRSPRLLVSVDGPAWAAAQLGRATGTAHLRTLTPPPSADLAAQVRAALETGKPPGPALAKTIQTAAATEYARQAEVVLVGQLVREFSNDLDTIALDSLPRITADLNALLQHTLDEAGALNLDGITTADQAIEAGLVDDWTKFRECHRVYLQTRGDQAQILLEQDAALMAGGMRAHVLFGNVGGFWPEWLASTGNVSGVRTGGDGWSVPAHTPPWPEDVMSLAHFIYVLANRGALLPRIADAATIRAEWDRDRFQAHDDARADEEGTPRDARYGAQFDAQIASHARAAASRAESVYQDSTGGY